MNPELYFNKACFPALSRSEAVDALADMAKAAARLMQNLEKCRLAPRTSFHAAEGFAINETCFAMEGGREIYLGELHRELRQQAHTEFSLILEKLSHAKRVPANAYETESEDWTPEDSVPSCSFMAFAARREGCLLTSATDTVWKRDSIRFAHRSEALPNLWGHDNYAAFVASIGQKLRDSGLMSQALILQFGIEICHGALEDSDLAPVEWHHVFDLFDRARDRSFKPDQILIKPVGVSNHGQILELRHNSGLRVFVTGPQAGIKGRDSFLLGGYYKKGMALSQNHSIECAKDRINAVAKTPAHPSA